MRFAPPPPIKLPPFSNEVLTCTKGSKAPVCLEHVAWVCCVESRYKPRKGRVPKTQMGIDFLRKFEGKIDGYRVLAVNWFSPRARGRRHVARLITHRRKRPREITSGPPPSTSEVIKEAPTTSQEIDLIFSMHRPSGLYRVTGLLPSNTSCDEHLQYDEQVQAVSAFRRELLLRHLQSAFIGGERDTGSLLKLLELAPTCTSARASWLVCYLF